MTTTYAAPLDVRAWVPEAALAAAVLLVGLVEAAGADHPRRWPVLIGIAAAVLLARKAPAWALVIVWTTGALQLLLGLPVLATEAAVAVVAFGCARWGRPATVVLSGLSIPTAAAVGALLVARGSYGTFTEIGAFRAVLDSAYAVSDTLLVGATLLGLMVLAVPWLAGLAVRATVRARTSEVGQEVAQQDAALAQREAAQAQEIAALREDQARLARDVHDVVGHSLAVILAQAESAQYLPDDPAHLKSTLATIATSARTSLQDVRQVLSVEPVASPRSGGLEQLVAGIRASGRDVVVEEVGPPQPLPPELEVVAHRVLQEMLTNAVKHGRREHPIRVERHWPGGGLERDLRLEVRNVEQGSEETQPITAAPADAPTPGQGLEGMRRRVESVGGRLDVRRRVEPEGPTFTATAWVPVRA